MKKLFIFGLIFLMKQIACQWIDPHDMNTNAKEKYMEPTLKKSSSTSSIPNGQNNIDSEICFSHLKRIIGIFINSARIDKTDPNVYHGHILFNIDPDDFDFLTNFGKGNLALDKLRRLDTVFSDSFKKSFINEYLDHLQSLQLEIYSVVVNIHNVWLVGVVFLLYVVYQLIKNNFSFGYVLRYLIILVLICDFGLRYHHLLEQAEEHNASVTYSTACDPAKMTWREWFSTKDCARKTVTPLDAFLYQVKNIIIEPMHAFGTGMGGFGYNMFTNLPWGLNLIMWPLMLIFVIIMVVFTMVICTGQAIEFNIMHVIKLKFGGTTPVRNDNVLTGRTVEKLMDGLHRPMVQNITVSVPAVGSRENQENDSNSAPAPQNNNAASPDEIKSITNESTVRSTVDSTEKTESEGIKISLNENQSTFNGGVEGNSEVEIPKVDNPVDGIS